MVILPWGTFHKINIQNCEGNLKLCAGHQRDQSDSSWILGQSSHGSDSYVWQRERRKKKTNQTAALKQKSIQYKTLRGERLVFTD